MELPGDHADRSSELRSYSLLLVTFALNLCSTIYGSVHPETVFCVLMQPEKLTILIISLWSKVIFSFSLGKKSAYWCFFLSSFAITKQGVTVWSQRRSPSYCWSETLLPRVVLFAQREGIRCGNRLHIHWLATMPREMNEILERVAGHNWEDEERKKKDMKSEIWSRRKGQVLS